MSEEQTEYTLTNAEYHKLPSVSHGKLECFRRSKARYRAIFIDRTLKTEQTKAMLLGSLAHAMTFEPHKVPDLYAIAPKCDRRTNIGKADFAAFVDGLGDRTGVDAEVWQMAETIANAVLCNPQASMLLSTSGVCEEALHWTCPRTSLACRCKPDFRSTFGMPFIVDLKTCQDATPGGFASTAARFGYARQAAWYQWGHDENDLGPCKFIFIAVSTNEPYEVGLYELSEHDINRSKMQNEIDLAELAECERTGEFHAQHERGVMTLQLPKWVEYEDQYQVY